MRRFFSKLALLVLPFAVFSIGVALVDPFDRFRIANVVPEASKQKASRAIDDAVWQAIHFDRDPGENVLLGNSKMNRITPEMAHAASGLEYRNFAINGGTACDVVASFWFATERTKLRRVVVGFGLESFAQQLCPSARVRDALGAENPLLYVGNRSVLSASANLVGATFFGVELAGTSSLSKDEYWTFRMKAGMDQAFGGYVFSEQAVASLAEVGAYCREHGISLRFVLLPDSTEVHDALRARGLDDVRTTLGSKLARIAPTLDLDVDDEASHDRSNFRDPFHMDDAYAVLITREIFAASEADSSPSPR